MRLGVGIVFVLMGTLFGPARAMADEAPRVLIVEARRVDLPDLGPRALRDAVSETVKAQGAEVVASKLTEQEQAACDSIECFKAASLAAGATHVLRIDAVYAAGRYELQLRIWSEASGVIAGDRDRCKLCLAADMLRISRNQASYLCGKAFTATPAVASPPPLPPTGAPPPTDPPAVVTERPAQSVPSPPPPPGPNYSRIGAAVLGGIGLVAVGTGIVFLIRGDRSTCSGLPASMCGRVLSGSRTGALIGGVGVLAVTGAVVWWKLPFGRSSSGTSVAVVPDGILVRGEF